MEVRRVLDADRLEPRGAVDMGDARHEFPAGRAHGGTSSMNGLSPSNAMLPYRAVPIAVPESPAGAGMNTSVNLDSVRIRSVATEFMDDLRG